MSEKITVTKKVDAPVEQVYQAISQRNVLSTWLSNTADISAREDGRIYFWWNEGSYSAGKVLTAEENKELSFTWNTSTDPGSSKVKISLEGQNGSTNITLTHEDLGEGEDWEETISAYKQHWPNALENLQWTLEKGVDKRQFDRPFMGIYIGGQLNENTAKDLGVPVTEGIIVNNTVPGTGASEVGFESNDILHEMDGTVLKDLPTLNSVTARHKAEDVLDIVYYRKDEKKTGKMMLSRRPFPEFPNTAKEAQQAMVEIFDRLDEDLDKLFEDITEEEATQPPAEGQWSAKDNLAHLLYTERWYQLAVSCAIGALRNPSYSNDNGVIAAIVADYPTVKDLIEELKKAERTSARMIGNLSDDFVANKIKYNSLLSWPLQGLENHTRGHFNQITEAVQAVRGS